MGKAFDDTELTESSFRDYNEILIVIDEDEVPQRWQYEMMAFHK